MAKHKIVDLKGKNYTTTSTGKIIMIKSSKKELPQTEVEPNLKLKKPTSLKTFETKQIPFDSRVKETLDPKVIQMIEKIKKKKGSTIPEEDQMFNIKEPHGSTYAQFKPLEGVRIKENKLEKEG